MRATQIVPKFCPVFSRDNPTTEGYAHGMPKPPSLSSRPLGEPTASLWRGCGACGRPDGNGDGNTPKPRLVYVLIRASEFFTKSTFLIWNAATVIDTLRLYTGMRAVKKGPVILTYV